MIPSNREVAPSGFPKLSIVNSSRRRVARQSSAIETSVETEKHCRLIHGSQDIAKEFDGGSLLKVRAISLRLPLLSNNIAMRTGVSARLMSLILFGCPSTRSSKSSSFRLVTVMPGCLPRWRERRPGLRLPGRHRGHRLNCLPFYRP